MKKTVKINETFYAMLSAGNVLGSAEIQNNATRQYNP